VNTEYPKRVKIQSSCQYLFELLGSSRAKAACRTLMKLTLGVDFTNILSQSANVPAVIILLHSVSPAKLCQTLPANTIGNYAQFLRFTLYALFQ